MLREIEVKTDVEDYFFDKEFNLTPLIHNVGEWVATRTVGRVKDVFYVSTCAMEMEHYCVIGNAVSAHSIVKINEVTLRQ